jgi:hypothetical protein
MWRIRLAVRTPPSQGGDHGFESRMRYHTPLLQTRPAPPHFVFFLIQVVFIAYSNVKNVVDVSLSFRFVEDRLEESFRSMDKVIQ